MTAEHERLAQSREKHWQKWGPYLAERQWGTVREDYSAQGTAWDYFPHDHARQRTYRWGEDGLAGMSDDLQQLCLSLALWNRQDPFLKERLFGLTNSEGNHGEDVKELYYYLDATPTHSYLKMLYKYPQAAFPYADLIAVNGAHRKEEAEYELLDTGILAEDRYFDIAVEYAKAGPHDLLMRITVHNRGPEAAPLDLLPQLWFRNTWSWEENSEKPVIETVDGRVTARHATLGNYRFSVEGAEEWLWTENETNPRLFGQKANGFFKDAFHDYVVGGVRAAINPEGRGTKAAARLKLMIAAGESQTVRVRLARHDGPVFDDFDEIFQARKKEADEFYQQIHGTLAGEDERRIQRQALAGMIWNKQFFNYDVARWMKGDPGSPPPPPERQHGRNSDWPHLNNANIISMPDKWEYPWYAAWDLAFHSVALAMIDPEFAKRQLVLMTREWFMHPNGQLPAYEWAFGDVNPPVHGWATWRVFQMDRQQRRKRGDQQDPGDLFFLERVFHKLMLNFTWWVNRKDEEGRNIFQGGFLGLDNIGVFDRSKPLPTGGFINQADGTSWMAMYSLNLMRIALELSQHNHVYEDIATKFLEHFLHIAEAMNNIGDEGIGLWDEPDQFFYDVLQKPDGEKIPLKVRSLVGLIPLYAVEILDEALLKKVPKFTSRLKWFLNHRPDLAKLVSRWEEPGVGETRLLSLLRGHRMKGLLRRMLDETEFLSDYGVRALSKAHAEHPYVFGCCGNELQVGYQPGESTSALFGGNSNWRGPIWMPVNYLLIESLKRFHRYYGDDFKVECPTGSGRYLTIKEVANELGRRLTRIFLRDEQGGRAVFNGDSKRQNDPHFRDHLLFYEYFHGDTGRGLGAAHQTGWTGLIARLLDPEFQETL
jgi:hypothetical protein